jgi:thymidylate kinase
MASAAAVLAVERGGNDSLADLALARLEEVFARLDDAGIRFCLLRNRDKIPGGLLDRSDVDIVVPADTSTERLVALFSDLGPVQIVRRRIITSFYFPVGPIFLLVDFFNCDQEWRGARLLENQEILAQARLDEGIPVASEVHQAFLACFEKLLVEGAAPPRYTLMITRAARRSPSEFQALAQRTFGESLGDRLHQLVVEGRLHEMASFAPECRRAFWLRALQREPIRTLRGLAGLCGRAAMIRLRPPGLDVALLGPDGAGKSSVCAAISDGPPLGLPFKSVTVLLRYPRMLPSLAKLPKIMRRHPALAIGDASDPHALPAHGPLGSTLKLSYYVLDRWLWYLRRGRPLLARRGLLLHDRHMLELLVDSKRYRYGGPRWLARLATRLTPRPDLVVLLDAPPAVLQARKREVPFAETARQRAAYRALVAALPQGRVVDAARPAEEVAAAVRAAVVARLAARTARQFGSEAWR